MTTIHPDPNRDDERIRELLISADDQPATPPMELIQDVHAKLRTRLETGERFVVVPPSGKHRRRVWFLSIGVAAALLVVVVFHLQPSKSAWAQVAEAVHGKPWMRCINNEGKTIWLSFPRKIAAMQDGALARYDDYGAEVRYEYRPDKKKLFRLSASDTAAYQSMATFFQAIFRGDKDVGDQFAELHIGKRSQQTIEEQGKKWLIYKLEVLTPGPKLYPGNILIRVDPENHLPNSLIIIAGRERVEFKIDYPEEGPQDIYALGAPRDSVLEDHMPSADLKRILAALDAGRHDLDNYFAIVGGSPLDHLTLVWRKGNRWRVDYGLWKGPLENIEHIQHMESEADLAKCWREYSEEFEVSSYLVCDGLHIYRTGPEIKDGQPVLKDGKQVFSDWKVVEVVQTGKQHTGVSIFCDSRLYMIELFGYAEGLSSRLKSWPQPQVQIDPTGKNGPAGSLRVELLFAGAPANTYGKEEYWLDPQRGYVAEKRVLSDCTVVDQDSMQNKDPPIYEYDGYCQSPRGVWYPTVIRWKDAIQSQEKGQEEAHFSDHVTYFHLDFDVDLSDELFTRTAPRTPTKRAGN
jgi:hypothetical protein